MTEILTTHVGSLPRGAQVADLLFGREKGLPLDMAAYDAIMAAATGEILARQRAADVDIPSDGETSKISYATYVKDRLTGFDGDSPRRPRCVGPIRLKTLEPLHKDIAAMKAAMPKASVPRAICATRAR